MTGAEAVSSPDVTLEHAAGQEVVGSDSKDAESVAEAFPPSSKEGEAHAEPELNKDFAELGEMRKTKKTMRMRMSRAKMKMRRARITSNSLLKKHRPRRLLI